MNFNRRKRFAVYGGLLMTTAACMALVNGGSVGALTNTATTATTGATATTAAPATTAGPTTSTTVGTKQTTISAKATNTNTCSSVLVPADLPPSTGPVGVTIGASGFPQPHKGDPITLSKTTLTVSIPGSTLQVGVKANAIHDGDKIPAVATLVVAGSNTTEGTHTYTVNSVSTVKVVGGIAQALVGTSSLPNTTWHPKNATGTVTFTEKSLKIVATITIGPPLNLGAIVDTNTCTPGGSFVFMALSASGSAPPVTSGSTAPTGVTAAAVTTTTRVAAAAKTLPRTGANGVFLLIIAAALVDGGAALLLLTRRRRTL